MAISSSKSVDHWREVFREAGESDVFHVIRQAIRVAASNHPDEFRIRKDKIVRMLFTEIPQVEKADDEGHRIINAVKAIEEKKEEEESGRGNPVKINGALFAAPAWTPPSAEEEPVPRDAVSVVEEKAETKKTQETWKIVSVAENGKIRLRRVEPSKPHITTFTEQHQPDHEPRSDDLEGSLRSNLEAAKRKLRESFDPFEPRPKKFCRRPLQFRISGVRLR